jgi:DNA polymerase-3 subunit delta
MPDEKPVVYILRGDDREAIEGHIQNLYGKMGQADMAEMNTTRLDGRGLTLNDLRSAALALPFLSERRLVVVEDALLPFSGGGKQKDRKAFLELMDSLPQSTALVLVAPDSQRYRDRQMVWESLNEKHWLIAWAKKAGERAFLVDCALPTERDMPGWIQRKVAENGGSIRPEAASILADSVGNNTQRAAQEIIKLLTYVNLERPVEAEDVEKLTAQERRGDIFELVDAIGLRNGKKALDLMTLLLEDMDFGQLFGMIVRQFRLLLQAREIIDDGGTETDIAGILQQHSYVAQKLNVQVRHFDRDGLEAIYQRLLEIDVNAKTGEMDGEVALDVLIARLAEDV